MSESPQTVEELEKLKLHELKKLCKKHGLTATGTKLELVARLVESKGGSFSLLQPGEEEKLLGDDVEDEGNSFILNDSPTLDAIDKSLGNSPKKTTEQTLVSSPQQASKSSSKAASVKRPSETLKITTNEETKMETKNIEITPISTDSKSPGKSEDEILAKRANRFGLSRPAGSMNLTDDKLVARAKRFGLPVAESNGSAAGLRCNTGSAVIPSDEAEKLKRRAERFGEVTSKQIEKMDETARKIMRLERFGAVTTGGGQNGTSSSADAAAKAARAEKFGIETDEEKLLKRKARFGLA